VHPSSEPAVPSTTSPCGARRQLHRGAGPGPHRLGALGPPSPAKGPRPTSRRASPAIEPVAGTRQNNQSYHGRGVSKGRRASGVFRPLRGHSRGRQSKSPTPPQHHLSAAPGAPQGAGSAPTDRAPNTPAPRLYDSRPRNPKL
jgi:hypothetical protein